MNKVFLNKMERVFDLELCKVNRDVIGVIPSECIDSINRSITDIDTIDITIQKYIEKGIDGKIINPLWVESKDERLICLNNSEYFVIKTDDYSDTEDTKSIVARSLEYKLAKIDIKVEDIGFYLIESDIENGLYPLNDYMFEETGWKFGYIDDAVRYDINDEGEKTDKLRIQTSINMRWYDFLMNNVAEGFGCIVVFDTFNKLVNLYDVNTVGENIGLYLSNDNYVKSLQRTNSSEEIVTRLYLVGNEEMDIIGATVTGYPYLENYSYFMDNREMSDELMYHINKYNEMVEIRNEIWKDLVSRKQEKVNEVTKKKTDLYIIYEEIRALKSVKETYNAQGDTINEAIIAAEISKKIDDQTILEIGIKMLEEDIENLQSSIDEINILCKRETATDENGYIIFNDKTLDELKEFVYCDTYTNDSFLYVEDLLVAGKRELELRCKPTTSYSIDVDNFLKRVEYNGFKQYWNGEIGLSDIVILFDEDLKEEVFLYLTSYNQNPNEEDNAIELTLSSKKINENNTRVIADYLKEASLSMRMIKSKAYLLNQHKYKRINLSKEQIGGTL